MNFDNIKPIELADQVLLKFNDHIKTDLEVAFENVGIEYEDLADKYHRLYLDTTFILENTLMYIAPIDESGCWYRLTTLELEVKNAGGHFEYLRKNGINKIAEAERQLLNDEKLKYDVKNSKRIFKTYWWTFGFAVVGLVISLVLGVLKLLEVFQQTPVK